MGDAEQLQCELDEARRQFDEFVAHSNQIEQELNKELEAEAEASKRLRGDLGEAKQRVAELQTRLSEQMAALEASQSQARELDKALGEARARLVALETDKQREEDARRAAEASALRYQERYEKLLESTAVERCELEELRLASKERNARNKVAAQEEEHNAPQSALSAERELQLTKQLLKDLVSALSKGAVSLPDVRGK